MNTQITELNKKELIDDFSKPELFDLYLKATEEKNLLAFKNEELLASVEALKDKLKLALNKSFAKSSEKNLNPNIEQLSLIQDEDEKSDEHIGVFNEAEKFVEVEKKRKPRRLAGKVGPNKACFDHLPVEEVIEELTPENLICDNCGSDKSVLKKIERYEIVIEPPKIKKVKYVSYLTVCNKCEDTEKSPITNNTKRLPFFQGSYASASLVAYIMAKKYWEKMPIHRIEKNFWYSGIHISRSLMSRWVIGASSTYLEPIYERLHEEILKGKIIHADETKLQVLKEPDRLSSQLSYMWLYVSGHKEDKQISLYEYKSGRSGEHPKKFLHGFNGYLITDGYSGYNGISSVTRVGCHAHARRKFVDALKVSGKDKTRQGTLASEAIGFFDKLFLIEINNKGKSRKEIERTRLDESKPLLEALKVWLDKTKKMVTPKSKVGEAIQYCLNQWDNLKAFMLDPDLELSNNRAERGMKEFVIGRKNFLFSTSVEGAKASQVVFSIVETAKMNGLHPYEYIKYLLEELSQSRHTREKIEELLPWSDKLPENVKIQYKQ